MLIFDLKFTDGKACRYLCPDPDASEQAERAALEAIFCGRLASMVRIIAPPPERLPWRRIANDTWDLYGFKLRKCADNSDGEKVWCLIFLDQEQYLCGRDAVSAAVRLHWNLCV